MILPVIVAFIQQFNQNGIRWNVFFAFHVHLLFLFDHFSSLAVSLCGVVGCTCLGDRVGGRMWEAGVNLGSVPKIPFSVMNSSKRTAAEFHVGDRKW